MVHPQRRLPHNISFFFTICTFLFNATETNAADVSLKQVYKDVDVDSKDFVIHDPSRIITKGGKQMIAVTGEEQADGYNCGIETWYRKQNSKSNWKPGQCLLQTKPSWIEEEIPGQEGAYWAPELVKDNVMLYSVAGFHVEPAITCLGIARAEGKFPKGLTWVDSGKPLTCIFPNDYEYEQSIIDPSTFVSFDAKVYLVTGGGTIVGVELDPNTYHPITGDWYSPNTTEWKKLARGPKVDDVKGGHDWVEAAYVHPNPDTGYYFLFVNWGTCCSGVDSTYNIRVGRSKNPLGPYKDKNGKKMNKGGGSIFLKKRSYMIGPGHISVHRGKKEKEVLSFHYYDKRRGGKAWIAERLLKWQDDGWPKAGSLVSSYEL